MKQKFKNIIWDWNGTLFDDAWLCHEIMNKLLKRREMKEISLEDYRKIYQIPFKNNFKLFGFDLEKEPLLKIGMEFLIEYENRKFECSLRNGVLKTLSYFKKLEVSQFILSASQEDSLIELVDHFKISSYFNKIIGMKDYSNSDKLRSGLTLLNSLNLDKAKTILVGDALYDFDISEKLGIGCFLLSGGHTSDVRLKNQSQRYFLNSFDEIMV